MARNDNIHALKWMAQIRIECRKLLDHPPFVNREVTSDQYEAAAKAYAAGSDDPHVIFRTGHGNFRIFHMPDKYRDLCGWIEQLFDEIQKAASLHERMRQTARDGDAEYPGSIDTLAERCITIGMLATRAGIDLERRIKSGVRPLKTNRSKLLDDDTTRKLAEDEVKKNLRSNLKWTRATDRAALIMFRDHNIEISGKTIRRVLNELNPSPKSR